MPDDYSKLVPPLPIPNRTVKRLRADDSADSCVKVGHRQACIPQNPSTYRTGVFAFARLMLDFLFSDWILIMFDLYES